MYRGVVPKLCTLGADIIQRFKVVRTISEGTPCKNV
jgi:hypothetical protein